MTRIFSKRLPFLFCTSLIKSRTSSAFGAGSLLRSSKFSATVVRMVSSKEISGKLVVPVEDAIALHSALDVKFVDGSWFLKGRNGRQEFLSEPRIAGARFFDIDDIATVSPYAHMMPTPELFAAAMDAMGISNNDHLIVYASAACPFVHRAWFQIRNMGHGSDKTHLLDGSLEDWKAHGGPMEDGEPSSAIVNAKDLDLGKSANYRATAPQNIVDKAEVKHLISQGSDADAILVDARSPERFRGEIEEPRPGMRLGHMPGAKNIFFMDLLKSDTVLQFKAKPELMETFKAGGVDIESDRRIVVHCGSGATACAVVAAMELCGRAPDTNYVYDASWSEWGGTSDTPIEKDGNPVP